MQKIAAALVKAQREFGPALKTSTNPHFKNRYADLSSCVEAVIDALNNNGIYLMQMTHETPDGAMAETTFVHESGEMLSGGKLFFPASKHDAQGYASALSYVRRYSLMAACGIAPEDDDGNAASKPKIENKPQPKPEPKAEDKPKPKAIDEDAINVLMDMYITFLPEAKTEAELSAYWKSNAAEAKRIEQHAPDRYIELLGAFKKRKDELKGEAQ